MNMPLLPFLYPFKEPSRHSKKKKEKERKEKKRRWYVECEKDKSDGCRYRFFFHRSPAGLITRNYKFMDR